MSPPSVWGPAIWMLFHTLIEKLNPQYYSVVIKSLFSIIVRICKFLPCPECSADASRFLAKINLQHYKSKEELKNLIYLFHNYVNSKKRKPLFNHSHLKKYSEFNLINVINNFILKYSTKGNMQLIADSFQRTLIIKDFISWFKQYARVFIKPQIINPNQISYCNSNEMNDKTEKNTNYKGNDKVNKVDKVDKGNNVTETCYDSEKMCNMKDDNVNTELIEQ